MIVNKGFKPKRPQSDRLPPGQYLTDDYPVLSLGPTPKVKPEEWSLKIFGQIENPQKLDWDQFTNLPSTSIEKDIHCVTKWSKFDTHWKGIDFDQIIKLVNPKKTAKFVIFYSYDGYTTNLPIEDVINGQALIAFEYEHSPIPSEHGGPIRMVIPHLYFWKSAKWLNGIEFSDKDEPGFWEVRGYHNYGDPWKEQRYDFDE